MEIMVSYSGIAYIFPIVSYKLKIGIDSDSYLRFQAGALESTVKTSQLKIIELQHLVEALRYLFLPESCVDQISYFAVTFKKGGSIRI